MELKNILEEINKQTDKEIERIRESVNNEIAELKKEFDEKRRNFISKKKSEFMSEGELKKQGILTERKLALKKELHNKKRKLIENIFNETVERLQNLDKTKYEKLMEKLLKEVVVTKNEIVLPALKEEVFNKGFIARLNEKYKWNISLGSKTSVISGGFILKEKDYETVVDWNSIKEFIRQTEEDRVVESLFSKYE